MKEIEKNPDTRPKWHQNPNTKRAVEQLKRSLEHFIVETTSPHKPEWQKGLVWCFVLYWMRLPERGGAVQIDMPCVVEVLGDQSLASIASLKDVVAFTGLGGDVFSPQALEYSQGVAGLDFGSFSKNDLTNMVLFTTRHRFLLIGALKHARVSHKELLFDKDLHLLGPHFVAQDTDHLPLFWAYEPVKTTSSKPDNWLLAGLAHFMCADGYYHQDDKKNDWARLSYTKLIELCKELGLPKIQPDNLLYSMALASTKRFASILFTKDEWSDQGKREQYWLGVARQQASIVAHYQKSKPKELVRPYVDLSPAKSLFDPDYLIASMVAMFFILAELPDNIHEESVLSAENIHITLSVFFGHIEAQFEGLINKVVQNMPGWDGLSQAERSLIMNLKFLYKVRFIKQLKQRAEEGGDEGAPEVIGLLMAYEDYLFLKKALIDWMEYYAQNPGLINLSSGQPEDRESWVLATRDMEEKVVGHGSKRPGSMCFLVQHFKEQIM